MLSLLKLVRSVAGFSHTVLVLGAVAVACSGRSVDTSPKSCAKDADCGSGQRCDVPIDRPAIGMSPCAGTRLCSAEDLLCPTDQVCAPSWQSLPNYPYCGDKLCAPRCTADSCPPDAECDSEGQCRLTACDAAGAAPCPELWRCDPVAAATAPHDALEGTSVVETVDIERTMARGCVRRKCDESGGYECAAAWACKPASTTNAAGCIPEDCRDTKHCSDDTVLVCLTEAKHPGQSPLDVNSCVARTCDDGHSCTLLTENLVDVGRCDYGAPNADYYGCVAIPCTTDEECFNSYVCDHSSSLSDERGCRFRPCEMGNPCPLGSRCDPTAADRDFQNCAPIDGSGGTGTGGSAGNATGGTGTSGLGGSSGGSAPRVGGAGGTGSGGSAGSAPPRGQCVAR